MVEFICICILYRGNNFAKIISRFQYNTFGFVLCPLRLKLGCTVHQLARWLVTKSCCNQTAAELVVQPNCNTNSLLHQNGKNDQHGKMEKKIRPLSVTFLFRTSGIEYHSQAGLTRKNLQSNYTILHQSGNAGGDKEMIKMVKLVSYKIFKTKNSNLIKFSICQ